VGGLRFRSARVRAIWRSVEKLWEIAWRDAKRFEIAGRVVEG
jgi:hypothetical protein